MLCAEHIAFPLGKVARCGAARTVTDEGRPPAAGVLGTAVISESFSVGLYPAAHRAAYFPLCYAIFFVLSNGTRSDTIRIRAVDGGKVLTAYSGVNGRRDGKTAKSVGNVYFADSDLGDARQEWIPVEAVNSYKNVEKQYLVPPYPVSAVTADYDEDCDMIKAAKAAGGQVVCPKYPYSIHWGIDFA